MIARLEPLWGRPALRLDIETKDGPQRWLVASELHLGLESELARRGAFLRSRSAALLDQLVSDAKSIGAARLALLGDVKHKYTHTSPQEARDLPRFFERASESFEEVLITPGNHDTGLRRLLPAKAARNVRIGRPQGEALGTKDSRVALFHGHTWPRPPLVSAPVWLVGHTHVAASLVDENGNSAIEWAWLRGHLAREAVHAKYGRRSDAQVVVFPPYNPLCGGTPVNRDGLLGPLGRIVDPDASTLWLLDGRRAMDLTGHDLVARRRTSGAMD